MGKKSKGKGSKKAERKAFKKIAESMPDLGGLQPVAFSGGWPEGVQGIDLAKQVLVYWAETLENEDGWDAPSSITLIARPDISAADALASGVDSDGAADPTDATTGLMNLSMRKNVIDLSPTFYLWGHDADPGVSAFIVAEEAWKGDLSSSIPPSEQEDRRETRMLTIVTRSGVGFFGQFFRDGGEPEFGEFFSMPYQVLLYRCLDVPVPADLPRLILPEYLALFAAERVPMAQVAALALIPGIEEASPRSAVAVALMTITSMVRGITDDGQRLNGKDASRLRHLPRTKEAWFEEDDYDERVIPVLRDVIGQLTWSDYVRSSTVRQTLTEDSIMLPFDPPDWGGEDVLAAWAACRLGPHPTPAELMAELPADQRDAVLDTLAKLGLL